VLLGLYVLGAASGIVLAAVLKLTALRDSGQPFYMELPPYRMPSFHSLCLHTWEKGKHFLYKAGTYIFAMSVLVWFLLNLPWGVEHKRDSYLGQAGALVSPVLRPLGFGTWEASASLITGVIAKEVVVGSMGEIYAPQRDGVKKEQHTMGEDLKEIAVSFGAASRKAVIAVLNIPQPDEKEEDNSVLNNSVRQSFTPLSAYAFMAFVLLYMPCMVVAAAIRQEFGSWKWAALAYAYQTALAWCVALVIYQGGRWLGLGG